MGTDFSDDRLFEDMQAFEAAFVRQPVEVADPVPAPVILALDGSNQDPAAAALSALIAERFGKPVHVVYASEPGRDGRGGAYAEEQRCALVELGVEATAGHYEGQSYEQILAARLAVQAGIIVLPVPFLRDFEKVGTDSLTTTVDCVLRHTPVPVLCVRDPAVNVEACLRDILFPITVYLEENGLAGGYALALVGKGGEIRMLAIPDREVLEDVRHLLEDYVDVAGIGEESLARAMSRDIAGLVASMQRLAAERHLRVKVRIQPGNVTDVIAEATAERSCLIVVGAPTEEPDSVPYLRVRSIILRSRNPVLVT